MSLIIMDLCNESRSSGRQKLECWTLNTNSLIIFFVPAKLIGIIDFYYFIPISPTLFIPGGHKVSAKQNLLASSLIPRPSPTPPLPHPKFSSHQTVTWCGDEAAIEAEHPETTFE